MKVIIIGAGQNGVQAYCILKQSGVHEVAGFLDDNPAKQGSEVCGLPVLGGRAALPTLRKEGVEGGIVAIGDNDLRLEYTAGLIQSGYTAINAVHPWAMIDPTAELGVGVIVEMGVAIHPFARIGDCVFLGGSSVIAHHSVVERGALIAGGVVFGGEVRVGAKALIGVGASLQPHIRIGESTVVGVGAAVVTDLPDNVVAVGVPAKVIRQRRPDTPTG